MLLKLPENLFSKMAAKLLLKCFVVAYFLTPFIWWIGKFLLIHLRYECCLSTVIGAIIFGSLSALKTIFLDFGAASKILGGGMFGFDIQAYNLWPHIAILTTLLFTYRFYKKNHPTNQGD